MANTTSLRWTKSPPDGTSYHYWEAPGGWVICTRPGFRYALEVPLAWRPGVCLRFDSLAQAQAAAEWPREQLLSDLRDAYEAFIASIVGTSDPDVLHLEFHQRALEDDRMRSATRVASIA